MKQHQWCGGTSFQERATSDHVRLLLVIVMAVLAGFPSALDPSIRALVLTSNFTRLAQLPAELVLAAARTSKSTKFYQNAGSFDEDCVEPSGEKTKQLIRPILDRWSFFGNHRRRDSL